MASIQAAAQNLRDELFQAINASGGVRDSVQLPVLVTILSLTVLAYMIVLFIRVVHHVKGHEMIWLMRRTRRLRGTYIIANGTLLFTGFHFIFNICLLALTARGIYKQQHRILTQPAEAVVAAVYSICLSVSAWYALTSQWVSVAFSSEETGTRLTRWMLPPPWAYHLYTIGFFAAGLIVMLGGAVYGSIMQVKFLDLANQAYDILSAIANGTESGDRFIQVLALQKEAAPLILEAGRGYKILIWSELAIGFSMDIIVLPATFVLIKNLWYSKRILHSDDQTSRFAVRSRRSTRSWRWSWLPDPHTLNKWTTCYLVALRTFANTVYLNLVLVIGVVIAMHNTATSPSKSVALLLEVFIWANIVCGLVIALAILAQTLAPSLHSKSVALRNTDISRSKFGNESTLDQHHLSVLPIHVEQSTCTVAVECAIIKLENEEYN